MAGTPLGRILRSNGPRGGSPGCVPVFICDIIEAFFGFSDFLFARFSVIPWCSPQPNQEMLVTRLPAIRFCLNHDGFEYFFKPDLSSMVSGP